MYNNEPTQEAVSTNVKAKKKKAPNLVSTFFRNALRSNLDLTSLADTKAGILISLNGFILTVSVTASSFTVHSKLMTYAFISIILTSLGSIILAVLSVKPRTKNKLVNKEFLEDYHSLLYYQDMADMSPIEYHSSMNKALKSSKRSKTEMISHLHILGAEIKKKYFWLKYAYTFFSTGLILTASLIVYALMNESQKVSTSQKEKEYFVGKFYNIFEPSGATTVEKNKVLIVEDESSSRPLKLITFDEENQVVEIGDLHIPKKIKKSFKKEIEDLEAITSNGNIVYAITSHSLNRSNEQKKAREKLLMFHYEDESIIDMEVYNHLKDELIALEANLFGDKLLGYNAINIEGLTVDTTDNSLVLGFRAPLHNAKAIILAIKNPKELFTKNPPKPLFKEPLYIDLNGLGIRGIKYDEQKNGYWIIAGDAGQRTSKFQLYFLDKNTQKASLVKKDLDVGHSEGITIVENGAERFLFCVEDNGEEPNKAANYIKIGMDSL
ncbi:DUF3616 domain-containing protein [Sulfurimonas marina]|uniref:DUF3616 domain-containing protein n=1 Tax=Sulfurimonas marina TaxID=2590551 RepID=A0A7M3V9B2_9BACT|nr:DUF3616 domain-containing protein [Sulfurimonas marina]QOP40345.1 DUF3616 domain-containing protein [Sulfurimonas marina]